MTTLQERMQSKLEQVGIPAKQIHCYGQQIVITAWGEDAASRWVMLLAKFAKVKGVIRSIDYAKENHNTVLRPSTVDVWRIYARV